MSEVEPSPMYIKHLKIVMWDVFFFLQFLINFFKSNYFSLQISSKQAAAIKCISKKKLSSTAVDNIVTEIKLLKLLKHPHIVEMLIFFSKFSSSSTNFLFDHPFVYSRP